MQRVGMGDLFSVEVPDDWRPVGPGPDDDRPRLGFETGLDAHVALCPLPTLAGGGPPPTELLQGLTGAPAGGTVLECVAVELPCGRPAARIRRALKDGAVLLGGLVVGDEVTVFVNFVCGSQDLARLMPPFEHVLASFRFGSTPAARLAREVAEAVRAAAPDLEVRTGDVSFLLVRAPGGKLEAQLGLSSLAARIEQAPERRGELIAEHVARMPLEGLRSGQLDQPPILPECLFPRLVPRARLDAVMDGVPAGYDGPQRRPFAADDALWATLVTTTFDGHRYLNAGDLQELGMTWEQAFGVACANLEAELERRPPQAFAGPGGRTLMIVFEGPHAAACLLLPSLHAALTRRLGAEFLCCAPALDELVAFRADDRKLAETVTGKARASFEQDPYPVTSQVFTVGRGGVGRAAARPWWKVW